MSLTKYTSSKITTLSTILILMVLYIHSYYNEGETYPRVLALQRFFSGNGICGAANLLFFTLSGFLFFNGIQSVNACFPKIKKRLRTLLIPYIIWNIIFVLWYVVLGIMPGIEQYVNSDIMSMFSGFGSAIYGLFWMPANFPLWFIRDLLIVILCSPLIYLIVKYTKWVGVVAIFILSIWLPFRLAPYFILGACIAVNSYIERLSKKITPTIAITAILVFVGVCAYRALQPTDYVANKYFSHIFGICALISVWKLYDYIVKERVLTNNPFWRSITGYSFFVFLFHEPAFNIIKKLGLMFLGVNEWSLVLLYLVNPILMMAFAITAAKCIQKFLPKVYSILVGGR